MLSPRYRKLIADVRAEWGRILVMLAAIAVSLVAIGAVLGAYSILSREMARNYLGTKPAHATLEFPEGVSPELLDKARRNPKVAAAEAREVVLARSPVGSGYRPTLLFVIDDYGDLRLNTFLRETGAWPPPKGTILLERSAVEMAKTDVGGRLVIKTPHGVPVETRVTGLVHDPGLAPAWQERTIYAYTTRETLALLGEKPVLHELRVTFRDEPRDVRAAEAEALALAHDLEAEGHKAHEIRVPPPRRHPHEVQMKTILSLLLVFAVFSLLLSSILVATSLAAMLARQVREIGVMKALGARRSDLSRLYGILISVLGVLAFVVALPLGWLGAWTFAGSVSDMLNFTLVDTSIPLWVTLVQMASGVVVPLVIAAYPILRATSISVRSALEEHGVRLPKRLLGGVRLPVPVRNVLRRPGRFALTVFLLATGGALFITGLSVSRAWEKNIEKIYAARHYDVEVRFHEPERAEIADALAKVPGVRKVERWGHSHAAFAKPGVIDIAHTYPDRGHGSLVLQGPPPSTKLVTFPVLAGRWLEAGDRDGVVLNHLGAAQAGNPSVGSEVLLSMEGTLARLRVLGIVEEVGSPGAAYVTDDAFAEIMGTKGTTRMMRITTSAESPEERGAVIRRIEDVLRAERSPVEAVIPFAELRTAVGDHVLILVQALVFLATILAIVGLLGLTSAMGTSVVERTREIGIMKALGATPSRIRKLVLEEAFVTTAVSFVAAIALTIPLTYAVEGIIGRLGFLAPLPFVVSASGIVTWLVLLGAATLLAVLPPVRRASNVTVQEALAET